MSYWTPELKKQAKEKREATILRNIMDDFGVSLEEAETIRLDRLRKAAQKGGKRGGGKGGFAADRELARRAGKIGGSAKRNK